MKKTTSTALLLLALSLAPLTPCKGDDQTDFKIGYLIGRALVDAITDQETSSEQIQTELEAVDAGWELAERLSDGNANRLNRQPGRPHSTAPHVMVSADGSSLSPEAGYRWLNDVEGDLRVVWSPFTRHPQYPNVISGNDEGDWRPAAGYRWLYPSLAGNFDVVRSE